MIAKIFGSPSVLLSVCYPKMHFVGISLMQDLLLWSIFSRLTSSNLSFMQNETHQHSTTKLPICQTDWDPIFLFCKMMLYTYKSVDLTPKCDGINGSLRVDTIYQSLYVFLVNSKNSDNTHLICVIRRWQCFVFFLWNGLLVKKTK